MADAGQIGIDIYDEIKESFNVLISAIRSITSYVPVNTTNPLAAIFDHVTTSSRLNQFRYTDIEGFKDKAFVIYTEPLRHGMFGLQVHFYETNIQCNFAQYKSTSNVWKRNDRDTNNVSITWDRHKKQHIYGVKMSQKYPYIRGSMANRFAFQLVQACRIPRLVISDSAYVSCLFSKNISTDTPVIDIENFSIARILNGKSGFYHTAGVRYMEPELAERAIEFLQTEYCKSLSPFQKEILEQFDTCMKLGTCHTIEQSNCKILNQIIENARKVLSSHGFAPTGSDENSKATVLDKLVYTYQPEQRGGGKKRRKKTRNQQKKRKKTRKQRKIRKHRQTCSRK